MAAIGITPTREDLLEALPEVSLISDSELRRKVEDAWLLAWKESGIVALEDAPLLAGGEVPRGVGLEHIRQTARITAGTVEPVGVTGHPAPDRDIAIAGALLHDIGKLRAAGTPTPQAPVRHPFWGAYIGVAAGLPPEVIHIIVAHSFEGDNFHRSVECMVVRYADFLSADILFRRELGITGNEFLKKHGFPPK